ncbi:hypothetical protein C0431_03155 [bacterium]|jgi:hypothetical protein|nr:hypothetical protein [bacterium]
MPHAARLAELFLAEFNLETEYIKGDHGILEVKHGDDIVYTNRQNLGYKPTNEEARAAMQAHLNR